jgi:hypothetical protein
VLLLNISCISQVLRLARRLDCPLPYDGRVCYRMNQRTLNRQIRASSDTLASPTKGVLNLEFTILQETPSLLYSIVSKAIPIARTPTSFFKLPRQVQGVVLFLLDLLCLLLTSFQQALASCDNVCLLFFGLFVTALCRSRESRL